MKLLKHTILPILTGLLFVYSALWRLLLFSYDSLFFICAYLLLAAALFRRCRDVLLIVGTAVLICARLLLFLHFRTFDFADEVQMFVPLWAMMAGIYLAGAILLLIPILINVAPNLKKYRPYANPLWFLPGLVMLAGIVVYGMMLASAMGQSAVQGIMTGIWSLNRVNTSMADAIGTLLIPLWMKLCAIEDLKPYEDMVGQMITPEQLEEKRKELGLANQKAAR